MKLLLEYLVVLIKEQLATLTMTTTTYDIKTMNTGEDIIEVVKLLSSITDTIIRLRDNSEDLLPELYVQKLLKVFQTTSVDVFNSTFRKLEDDLQYAHVSMTGPLDQLRLPQEAPPLLQALLPQISSLTTL